MFPVSPHLQVSYNNDMDILAVATSEHTIP